MGTSPYKEYTQTALLVAANLVCSGSAIPHANICFSVTKTYPWILPKFCLKSLSFTIPSVVAHCSVLFYQVPVTFRGGCTFSVVEALLIVFHIPLPDGFGFPNSHPCTVRQLLYSFWVTCAYVYLLHASFSWLSSVKLSLHIHAEPSAILAGSPAHQNGPFLSL